MYAIILNPKAGGGAAEHALPGICEELTRRGIAFRVNRTSSRGDASRLAEQAVREGTEGIILMGGDGTFFEAVNGIGTSGTEVLFAPCGTGNDFMRMFRLPKDTVQAVCAQLDSPVHRIDLGKCNDRYFLNVAGTGFDVDVLKEADRYKANGGRLSAYLRGAYVAIRNYAPFEAILNVDDGAEERVKATILSIGNGRFIGGGMKAVPGAFVDDGLFSVVMAREVKKRSIYYLLLSFLRGTHAQNPKLCRVFSCRKIRIARKGMTMEADGELFQCDEAVIELLPGALCTRLSPL